MDIEANDIIDDLLKRIVDLTRENAVKSAQIIALEKKVTKETDSKAK
ncbi:hypothetical protein [Mesobacillus stamsii]|uniref:Uncharacterized protein n=1 Tax=Mesobacillus stamsii TaxID=225347 RepID=A0ABU0FWE0_9BACI|nr:hypothetical protein [Mesobacillus stamsii]MDQ0414242.1 hypothetical protein [Mesobacillus stamsii]